MKQIRSRFSHWMGAAAVALVLSACGGGGGGGDGGGAPAVGTLATSAPTGTPTTVQGTVTYKRFDHAATTAALNYANELTQPVRGATVQLLFGATVLASTTTSANGTYSFSAVPGSSTYVIRVRAELKQASGAAQWDVTVRDNTASEALYILQSANFIPASNPIQNLTAASGWTGGAAGSYTGARIAAPFAILDTLYESQQKVLAANANTNFPLLKAFWSVNNNTAVSPFIRGGFNLGDIGASFFQEVTTNGVVTERRMYILGRVDNDTDEYDASVVAHEWGHYYQSALSRDDSTGGRHSIDVNNVAGGDNLLDRRIAFSEGWGNAWSGISIGRNFYADSEGNRQAGGFRIALNTGYPAAGPKGYFRERSVQYIIWNLSAQAGFGGIHAALTSNAFKTGQALTDIHSFASAYRTAAAGTPTTALNLLLGNESINSTSDAFGSAETNNGGLTLTLPYYREISATGNPVTVTGGNTLCTDAVNSDVKNSAAFANGDRNRHGHFVYARFTVPTAASRTITVVGDPASGVDTDFQLFRAGQEIVNANSTGNQTETRTVNLAAGDYVLVISDYNKASPGNTCYTVSIQ